MLAIALLGRVGDAHAAIDAKTVDKVASMAAGYAKSLGCAVSVDKRNVVPYSIEGKSLFLILYSIIWVARAGPR